MDARPNLTIGGSGATFYVAAGGSDANPCTRAAPCRSFNRGYEVASPGDTVIVQAGSYGDFTLNSPSKSSGSCDGYTRGASLDGCVSFVGTGNVTLGSIYMESNYVRLKDMTTFDIYVRPVGCTNVPPKTNMVFENLRIHYLNLNNVDHVGILGSEIGRGGVHGTVVQLADCGQGPSHGPNHLRFDGVWIHDAISDISAAQGAHLECFQGQLPIPQLTIRNSKFTNCAQWDMNVSGDNLLIENNQFGKTCSEQLPVSQGGKCDPGASWLTGCGVSSSNVTVRFNSFAEGIVQASGGCQYGGTNRYYGNVWNWSATCSWQGQFNLKFDYNVSNQGSKCGRHDRIAPTGFKSPDAPDYDFSLVPGSAAIGLVPASEGHPATDYEGDPRPIRSNADAGADQQDPAHLSLGRSIGKMKIGRPVSEVTAVYGAGRRGKVSLGGRTFEKLTFRLHGGLVWAIVERGTVVGLGTTSPYYTTENGLGVRADAALLRPWTKKVWVGCQKAFRREFGGVAVYVGLPAGKSGKKIGSLWMIKNSYDSGRCKSAS